MPNEQIKSEIETQTYYPSPPQKKKSKILWIIIGGIILVVVGGILGALATRVWDPLWNPFRPEPTEVIEKMTLEMEKLKTLHSRTKLEII